MKKSVAYALAILAVFGFWTFLFEGVDSAGAKDPDFPTKPINFIIPFSAGGPTDIGARMLLDAAGKYLGQPFVPINKPGGGGSTGAMTVMSAKPDGYTVGFFSGSLSLLSPHMEDCPFKDLTGFTFIANYGKYVWPVTSRGDAPFKNWKQFIEWARKNPRAVKCSIPAAKSHVAAGLALWEVEKQERVEFTYLVFPGSAESFTALLGGHINLEAMSLFPTKMPYLKDGKVLILTYLDKNKAKGFEDIPSLEELYGFKTPNYMGVWGPKGIPEYVLEKLEAAFARGVKDPKFIDVMNRMDAPVVYISRAELDKEVRDLFPKTREKVEKVKAEEKGKENK
jgi:tripartite-type tricarboxylate transporter receptor subunit TctC